MKEKIDRCRTLIAAIYNGSARRKDEVELCELLPDVLDAAEDYVFEHSDICDMCNSDAGCPACKNED